MIEESIGAAIIALIDASATFLGGRRRADSGAHGVASCRLAARALLSSSICQRPRAGFEENPPAFSKMGMLRFRRASAAKRCSRFLAVSIASVQARPSHRAHQIAGRLDSRSAAAHRPHTTSPSSDLYCRWPCHDEFLISAGRRGHAISRAGISVAAISRRASSIVETECVACAEYRTITLKY